MLELRNIGKSFMQGEREISVLKGLSLKVEKGERVAILGQSGSGKSTLLSLLSGIDRPDTGEILFEGERVDQMSETEVTRLRSQKIGIIFQQFHLLPHLTALENTQLPLEILGKSAMAPAKEALKDVGLDHRFDHFPNQLSGGEKQRVAIARSLVIKPQLLLADEPSGSLDEKTGQTVMEMIFSLAKEEGHALILVTHNEDLAKSCERIYRLEGGLLHES